MRFWGLNEVLLVWDLEVWGIEFEGQIYTPGARPTNFQDPLV